MPEDSKGGGVGEGSAGFPSSAAGRGAACTPRLHVCGAARPSPSVRPAAISPASRSGCRPSRTQSGCRKRSFIHYLRALIGLGRADWGRRRRRRGDPSVRARVRTCGKVCGAGVGRAQTLFRGRALSRTRRGGYRPPLPSLHGLCSRVPDAALASFIIIFGQVECARNSCFTRLTSEGGYSGNQENE